MTEPIPASVPIPEPTPAPPFPPVVDTVVADAPVAAAVLKAADPKLAAKVTAEFAKRRKTLVAAASAIVAILGTGLIHGDAELALNTVILVLGVIGVHAVPNAEG